MRPRGAFLLFIPILTLAACRAPEITRAPSRAYDLDEVTAVARQTLTNLQAQSFAQNREFCGVIGIDPAGEVQATTANRGGRDRCLTVYAPIDWHIIASYHTHGGYVPDIASEVPSIQDLNSVAFNGLIGFLSTPGGRFWLYGREPLAAELICGPGCLPQDPTYIPDEDVADSYTREELMVRNAGK